MMSVLKKKVLIYLLSAISGFIIAALVSGLAFDESLLYAFFFGMFGAAVSGMLARVVYHLSLKDYAPEMWQITIYIALSAGGWLGAVLATTWGWVSLWLSVMCIGLLMAFGTRFCKEVAKQRTSSSLERTLRYRFVDDVLGGTPNLDAPLCLVKGTAMTVEEAEKAGANDKAEEGRAYIHRITGGK